MKLSKILFVGLIVVFIFSLSACVYAPASYVCDINTVDSVQIVRIGQLNEETREFEYAVIVDIVDCSTFVGRLNNLEDNDFFFLLGDPDVFFDGDVAIRVNYHNGDYDLLKCKVQKFYRSGVSARLPSHSSQCGVQQSLQSGGRAPQHPCGSRLPLLCARCL